MYLLDSNIIIYYAEKQYDCLDAIFQEETLYVSEITRLEVLGYHRIGDLKSLFEQLFEKFSIIAISRIIVDTAILIRQQRRALLNKSVFQHSRWL